MGKIAFICFFLLLIVICTAPAAAVPITVIGEPQTIYEFQDGYYFNTVTTDGKYVLIAERMPNAAQKTGQPIEGYRWLGSLYLYDIVRKTLEKVPGDIPSEQAVMANGTVYWIDGSYGKKTTAPDGFEYLEYTTRYYQYTPGDAGPIEINIPQDCHLSSFATDGTHLVMARSEVLRGGVLEGTLTVFDLRSGEWERLPLTSKPNAYSFAVSGDYVVYVDDGRDLPALSDRYIHVYNISSKETYDIERPDGYVQLIDCVWDELLLYSQMKIGAGSGQESSLERYVINLRSKEVESVVFSEDLNPLQIYPPYAAFWRMDEPSEKLVAKFAMIDMSSIPQSSVVFPTEDMQTVYPQTTQAGSPASMIIGFLVFILSCVLAVLWREK